MLRSASSQARCLQQLFSRRACALLLGVVEQDAALGILASAPFLQQLFPGAHAHYY